MAVAHQAKWKDISYFPLYEMNHARNVLSLQQKRNVFPYVVVTKWDALWRRIPRVRTQFMAGFYTRNNFAKNIHTQSSKERDWN
jgi:hypothetical protein